MLLQKSISFKSETEAFYLKFQKSLTIHPINVNVFSLAEANPVEV